LLLALAFRERGLFYENIVMHLTRNYVASDSEEIIQIQNHTEHAMQKYLNNILHLISFSDGETEIFDSPYLDIDYNQNRPSFFLPRMWATYGENHRGACFVFDKDKFISITKNYVEERRYYFKHGIITYADFFKKLSWFDISTFDIPKFRIALPENFVRRKTIEGSVQEFLANNTSQYFTKDLDWRDENEYRFLCWNNIDNYCLKEIEVEITDALIGIVLGINSHNNKQIIEIAKKKEIDVISKIKIKHDGKWFLDII